ncbi:MAG: magnesium-transporting ATPase (P-type) [Candidatus Poriferisodalaceae bacterium]
MLRDGRIVETPAAGLVPGDVVRAASLRIEEATLTGESESVDKHTEAITEPNWDGTGALRVRVDGPVSLVHDRGERAIRRRNSTDLLCRLQ